MDVCVPCVNCVVNSTSYTAHNRRKIKPFFFSFIYKRTLPAEHSLSNDRSSLVNSIDFLFNTPTKIKKKKTKTKQKHLFFTLPCLLLYIWTLTQLTLCPNNKNEITFRSIANLQRLSLSDWHLKSFFRDLKYRDILIYCYNIRVERVETLAAVC